ncbi:diguanylate cyclase [Shewanella sp.]|uniref:diguanylate cyclase domain-containing protein n=1 Tax=Shewanella sp. TaxID=50422 RepID=UPI0025E863B0|nr:diguanylate cyclase [Shewanella sp.]
MGVYRIEDMFDSAIKRTSAQGIYYLLADKSLDPVYGQDINPGLAEDAGVLYSNICAVKCAIYLCHIEVSRLDREQRTADPNAAKRQLEQISLTDSLTKIPNRRSCDESLQQEWQKAIRDKSRLGLMMIDIDHFKQYNDTYGIWREINV